jgi:hypothetical protein
MAADGPPTRPPSRDPTAPARLLALAEELAVRAHDARRQLDAVAEALDRVVPGGAARLAGGQDGALAAPDPVVRLVAIEMAMAGATRADVADVLARDFGRDDTDALLDGVFGRDGRAPAAGR